MNEKLLEALKASIAESTEVTANANLNVGEKRFKRNEEIGYLTSMIRNILIRGGSDSIVMKFTRAENKATLIVNEEVRVDIHDNHLSIGGDVKVDDMEQIVSILSDTPIALMEK